MRTRGGRCCACLGIGIGASAQADRDFAETDIVATLVLDATEFSTSGIA
jgi:hypothetical protein